MSEAIDPSAPPTRGFHAGDRAVLRIAGPDGRGFLQGLVTSDVRGLDRGPVYAAILTPQGKYLFDFLLVAEGPEAVLLDVKADRAAALAERLGLYRLRARVEIAPAPHAVVVGLGPAPAGAFADPRDPGLGWRLLTLDPGGVLAGIDPLDPGEWRALRVLRAVPETGIELVPEETYILEAGFERLGGVDFRKGCFVGQEIVARMKHKAALRKGLVAVAVEGSAPPPGSAITDDAGRVAGTLHSVAGERGLAHLRFDRAEGALMAGEARLRRLGDPG